VLATSGVSLHLIEVPLSGGIGLLRVKGGANLDEALLKNPHLILPRGKGFLPPCELHLSRKDLLNHCSWWRIHEQISNASSNISTYCKGQPKTHLPGACV
jgi:hypothetical protein